MFIPQLYAPCSPKNRSLTTVSQMIKTGTKYMTFRSASSNIKNRFFSIIGHQCVILLKSIPMMITLFLFACSSSEDSAAVVKDTSAQSSNPENNNPENNNPENNTQAAPDLEFEWGSEEKITKQPDDTGSGLVMPNFSRTDLNPFSSSYGSEISPQGYLGSITGWYFIKAT